jgi:hypothetical protein
MAVAAPKLRSASPAAPPPSRTAPPEPKKRPRDRPKAGGRTATPRKVRIDDPPAKPGRRTGAKKASARAAAAKAAPARKAPARRKVAPRRRPAGVIPIAAGHAGRAAVAVTQLPESGLIHRLTRGRIWIGVLGVLLVGIVALNVVTLSFAASAGKVDERIQALSRENSVLASLQAKKYGQARINHEAKKQGLSASTAAEPIMVSAGKGDVGTAAKRLAAAAAAAGIGAANSEGEASAGESNPGEEAASGGGAAIGEGTMSAEEAAAVNLEGLSQEEKNAIYEETLAREAAEPEGAGVESEVSYEEPVYEQSVTEVPTE